MRAVRFHVRAQLLSAPRRVRHCITSQSVRVQEAAARVCNPFSETGHLALLSARSADPEAALLVQGAHIRSDEALADAARDLLAAGVGGRAQAMFAVVLAAAALAARLAGDARALLAAATVWCQAHLPPEEVRSRQRHACAPAR